MGLKPTDYHMRILRDLPKLINKLNVFESYVILALQAYYQGSAFSIFKDKNGQRHRNYHWHTTIKELHTAAGCTDRRIVDALNSLQVKGIINYKSTPKKGVEIWLA